MVWSVAGLSQVGTDGAQKLLVENVFALHVTGSGHEHPLAVQQVGA
jgi:hypothetical protein